MGIIGLCSFLELVPFTKVVQLMELVPLMELILLQGCPPMVTLFGPGLSVTVDKQPYTVSL